MAIYAVGDLQGCHDELVKLLELIDFDPEKDFIWFTGDLVNRGPKSLETLRLVYSLRDSVDSVLGNHDLHVLAIALGGNSGKYKVNEDIQRLLDAPDRDELVQWLRQRPLFYKNKQHNFIITHAGIYPAWDVSVAETLAKEAEELIYSAEFIEFIGDMYGNKPSSWSGSLKGNDRIRFIINAFTRMRFCDADMNLLYDYKKDLANAPDGYIPWYELQKNVAASETVVFGHWSALGYKDLKPFISIDSGCLWGGKLTALRLDDSEKKVYHYDGCGYLKPF